MSAPSPLSMVQQIMLDFAELTGLGKDGGPRRRYLWTDAFAVCNFLELYRQTQEESWRDIALLLVDQVHDVLGRHRPDEPQTGWLSGLSEEEGALHPTLKGLRIGKPLNERKPGEPPDERIEWDRDGQYYHYLTKWMHALHRVSRATGEATYLRWAVELAKGAHAGFSHSSPLGCAKKLYWKMSIDLSRPQVLSMGQHDPLEGLVTYCELQAAANALKDPEFPNLHEEISETANMCRATEWATQDPLGIGGLLCDASRIAQLVVREGFRVSNLFKEVFNSALPGLESYAKSGSTRLPVKKRLAFRELGLSIGLKGIERLPKMLASDSLSAKDPLLSPHLDQVANYLPLAEKIENFWLDPENQKAETWKEHREINIVMLATSLAPEEFLKAD